MSPLRHLKTYIAAAVFHHEHHITLINSIPHGTPLYPLFHLFPEHLHPRKFVNFPLKLCCTDGMLLRPITSITLDCPGIPLTWDPEDPLAVFRNYPWTHHAHKDHALGYQFPTANYKGEDIVGFDICATYCTGCSENRKACWQCWKLDKKVDHLHQLSQQ